MPFLCLEAWKRENITLFQKSNLQVCRGVSRYEPLTARMPQTHWPILQLLVADHHSYTSSTASLAARPAFLDTRKLSGSTQDYSYNAPQCGGCLWIPWATWALRVHCVHRAVLGTPGRNYSSTSSTEFWALGIQARAPHRNLCEGFVIQVFPVSEGGREQQKYWKLSVPRGLNDGWRGPHAVPGAHRPAALALQSLPSLN